MDGEMYFQQMIHHRDTGLPVICATFCANLSAPNKKDENGV